MPPFLVELRHRKHRKLVLAGSFNLGLMNDQGLPILSPRMTFAAGMISIQRTRMMNHLKKMGQRGATMSIAFTEIAGGWSSTLSDSEGEWVPPSGQGLELLGLPPAAPACDIRESESDDGEAVELAA
eukprot:1973628-Prymnesium_polylepis.1